MRIHLLHSNDIHSQLENHFRLGAQLRELRTYLRARGDFVLTFDLGDVMDRVRPETEATFGRINARLLGELELDGWVFGNNEGLTIPTTVWPYLVADSNSPVFGTNIRQPNGQSFPFFTEWKIFECEDVRIGVFGLTPNYDGPYRMLGIEVSDPFVAATSAVAKLTAQGCKLVVCLSHLGLWNDKKLAEYVLGIDVILGGHTHQFMKQAEYIGRTAIFQPGKHGLVFGHTTIEYNREKNAVSNISSRPVEIELHHPFDEKMSAVYESNLEKISEQLNTTVAVVNGRLPVLFDGESPFANLLVDAMFAQFPSDLGIMMNGALTASLLPGKIRLEDVHGACPTPTRPVVMSLTGENILHIIEKGITNDYFSRRGVGYGFRGAVVGYLALANMDVQLECTDEQVRIHSIKVQGLPLDNHRVYRVVTCEYLWLAPVFHEFKDGVDIAFQRPLVREILLQCLNDSRMIERARVSRYHVQSTSTRL